MTARQLNSETVKSTHDEAISSEQYFFWKRQRLRRLVESAGQSPEWAVGRRYFSTEAMNKLYEPSQEEVAQALLELQSA
jgi:hypothetical protein